MTIATVLGGGARPIVTLPVSARVADAVALLVEHRIGAMPVMDDNVLAGIISERDVIRLVAEDGATALSRRVADVMTTPAVSVGLGEPAIGALSLMTRRRVRHLPVIEDGRLVGFISIGDLVKYRIDRIEADAAAMRAYIQSA